MRVKTNIQPDNIIIYAPFVIGLTILGLLNMGRKYTTQIWSSEDGNNSVFDPYSFSNFIYGMLFNRLFNYYKKDIYYNLFSTISFICAWILFTNTDYCVNLRGNGDSINNAIGDIICSIIGWFFTIYIGAYNTFLVTIFIDCFNESVFQVSFTRYLMGLFIKYPFILVLLLKNIDETLIKRVVRVLTLIERVLNYL